MQVTPPVHLIQYAGWLSLRVFARREWETRRDNNITERKGHCDHSPVAQGLGGGGGCHSQGEYHPSWFPAEMRVSVVERGEGTIQNHGELLYNYGRQGIHINTLFKNGLTFQSVSQSVSQSVNQSFS